MFIQPDPAREVWVLLKEHEVRGKNLMHFNIGKKKEISVPTFHRRAPFKTSRVRFVHNRNLSALPGKPVIAAYSAAHFFGKFSRQKDAPLKSAVALWLEPVPFHHAPQNGVGVYSDDE